MTEGHSNPGRGQDHRLFAPSAGRNRGAILEVLTRVLPTRGLVLEVASGTGEHAAWFARHLTHLDWQPSDPNPDLHASIEAYRAGLENLRPPLDLDVTRHRWPIERADAIVCINMIHIAPWAATEGLLAGAGRCLAAGGVVYLYGPYRRGGGHTAPSNAAFDASLRASDPRWGVRDLEAVIELASEHGLDQVEIAEMPANNLSVVLARPDTNGINLPS